MEFTPIETQEQFDSMVKDRVERAKSAGAKEARKEFETQLKDLESIKGQYNTLKADYDKQKTEHANELINFRIDNEIASAKGALKFKAELPESATSVLLEQAIGKIKAQKHEYVDDGKGGQRLVFMDANGAIMRNAEKQLEPYTIGDLLTKELKLMGVLDEGRQQQGGGTQPPRVTTTEQGIVIDLSGVRTQTQAQELIAQTLMKQGLTNGSKAFQEAMTKAWVDNNIQSLPIQ
jgi:hypothetical protein